EFLVHDRRARLQRGERIEHRGQRRVVGVDQRQRLFGDLGRLGRHRGHLVPDAAHLAALERDLVLGEAEGPLLDVLARQHRAHARRRPRPPRVDLDDPRVRHRRAQDLPVQEPRQLEVVQIAGATRDLVRAVPLRGRFADDVERLRHRQNFTASLCSPKTSRIAWAISPRVAYAFTASMIGYIRFSRPRAASATRPSAVRTAPPSRLPGTRGISPETTRCSKRYACRATSAWIAPVRTASTMPPMRSTLASSSWIRFSMALVSA